MTWRKGREEKQTNEEKKKNVSSEINTELDLKGSLLKSRNQRGLSHCCYCCVVIIEAQAIGSLLRDEKIPPGVEGSLRSRSKGFCSCWV